MLFHYWKVGNYILYHQQQHGWGSKIIKQLAKAIRFNYPEKKGYSERNLTYMCQFARTYPLSVLRSFIDTDVRLSVPNIQNVTNEVLKLNDKQFTQGSSCANSGRRENRFCHLQDGDYGDRKNFLELPCRQNKLGKPNGYT